MGAQNIDRGQQDFRMSPLKDGEEQKGMIWSLREQSGLF